MAQAATQLYSTGPALFYVSPPGQSAASALFLGTAADKPRIEVFYDWEPVINDLAGSRNPLDKMYQGKRAMVTASLGRFDYQVYEALCSAPNIAAALAANGPPVLGSNATTALGTKALRDDPGDVGSLYSTEALGFWLYIAFPYNIKAAMGGGARLIPGYRFFAPTLDRNATEAGTTPHERQVIFDCQRVPNMGIFNAFGAGAMVLGDYAVAGLLLNT